ncbi:MAG: type II toxin-antitoxin system HicB family antitoxin [Halobacteriales archaeon]
MSVVVSYRCSPPPGVASTGKQLQQGTALENLDEAVALQQGDAGEPIEDEAAFLKEIGIDPDETPDEPHALPEFLR